MLILKSPSENKNYCTQHTPPKKKRGFTAEALIMLLEIWT